MTRCRSKALLGVLTSLAIISATGCTIAGIPVPIPVSPYYQQKQEDKFDWHEMYDRVPILGPTTAGGPPIAIDPPTDHEVMMALEKARPVQGGVPFFYEKQRNNVRIIKEKIADYVDPPRHYPLLGPAQLHHAHYKCTIHFSERDIVGLPVPHSLEDRDAAEVLYIDHNHFHMVGNVDDGAIPLQ
jgi:hypothetical protein